MSGAPIVISVRVFDNKKNHQGMVTPAAPRRGSEVIAFWVGSRYTCPGKGAFRTRKPLQPPRPAIFKAGAGDAGAASS